FLAVAIPVSVWIAVGPTQLIALVLGPEWTPVVPILQALSPLFMSQVLATVTRMTLLASEQSHVDRLFSFLNLILTAAAVLAAVPFGILGVALALSLSGILLRAPLLAWLAIRKGSQTLASVMDGLRVIALLAAISAAGLLLCRLLPVPGIVKDVLGLFAVAGVSAVALIVIVRRRSRESAA